MKITTIILLFLSLLVFSCNEIDKKNISEKIEIAKKNKELLKHIYTEVFVNWNKELIEEVSIFDISGNSPSAKLRTGKFPVVAPPSIAAGDPVPYSANDAHSSR